VLIRKPHARFALCFERESVRSKGCEPSAVLGQIASIASLCRGEGITADLIESPAYILLQGTNRSQEPTRVYSSSFVNIRSGRSSWFRSNTKSFELGAGNSS
jgi:hypothetical protein